ncbi:hypothetical protein BaRGS_00036784 [Batillaria attramentaria]|uniref:Uncharacterized protein n=1 Tax=Batillaria attramentaria TaxID=370345 RepID=A0ABD0JAG8_9CAEN
MHRSLADSCDNDTSTVGNDSACVSTVSAAKQTTNKARQEGSASGSTTIRDHFPVTDRAKTLTMADKGRDNEAVGGSVSVSGAGQCQSAVSFNADSLKEIRALS